MRKMFQYLMIWALWVFIIYRLVISVGVVVLLLNETNLHILSKCIKMSSCSALQVFPLFIPLHPYGYLLSCIAVSWDHYLHHWAQTSESLLNWNRPDCAALCWWHNMLLVILGSLTLNPWQSSQFCWSSLAQWGLSSSVRLERGSECSGSLGR